MTFADLPHVRCLDSADATARYAAAERGTPGHTPGVLIPETPQALADCLKSAAATGIPLVVSGGRTGLVEAQVPRGEWVLSTEKLRHVQIDAANRRATVGAGMPVDALNEALAPHGLFWPMEMGSTAAATVGACVANASAGANAVRYGTAAHLCASARGYWADGTPTGEMPGPVWQQPQAQVTAIDSASPDVALGLIGTQGVLGVITELDLRLYPLPAQREAALIPAHTMADAMRVLAAARARFGDAIEEFEFMGAMAIKQLADMRGEGFRLPYAVDAAYHLLLQVATPDPDADLASALYSFLADDLALPEEHMGYAPLPALKAIRHSLTEASNHAMRHLGGGRLAFDTATPLANFGAYLDDLAAQLVQQWPGLRVVAFGHAGVGGAHIHVLGNAEHPISRLGDAVVQAVFDITAAHGGTFSAEHGVGSKWGSEWQRRAQPSVKAALTAAKRQRDPAGVLAPRSFALVP